MGISELRRSSEDGQLEVQEVEVNVNEEVKGQDTPVLPIANKKAESPFTKGMDSMHDL